MQPILIGKREQSLVETTFLVETAAKPQSIDFAKSAGDTTGGCSVCRSTAAIYSAQSKLLRVTIAADARIPDGLMVAITVESTDGVRRYVPDATALATFVRTRTAEWQFPPGAPAPISMTIELTYSEGGLAGGGSTPVLMMP